MVFICYFSVKNYDNCKNEINLNSVVSRNDIIYRSLKKYSLSLYIISISFPEESTSKYQGLESEIISSFSMY